MQLCRTAWHSLTDLQRAAWRSKASNTTLPNRLGTHRNLTGQQLFIRTNFYNALFGYNLFADPPDPLEGTWPTSAALTLEAPNFIMVAPRPPRAVPGLHFVISGSRPVTAAPITHFHRWACLGLFNTDHSGLLYPGPEFVARFGTLQHSEYIAILIKPFDPLYSFFVTTQASGLVP